MKKILGISLIAMMAVTTARAEIASKAYVTVDQSANKEYNVITKTATPGVQIGELDTAIGDLGDYVDVMAAISAAQTAAEGGAEALVGDLDDLDTTAKANVVAAINEVKGTADAAVVANDAITGATKTKITYDDKGLVTAGADLVESDLPSLHLAKITDVTATAAEVNVLDGIEASTTELNYVKGVTSAIQTQLNAKQATLGGNDAKGKAVTIDATDGTATYTTIDTTVTTNSPNLVTSGAVKTAVDAVSLAAGNAYVAKAQGSTAAEQNKALITDNSGNVTLGTIAEGMITNGAVTENKLGSGAVTSAKIYDGTIVNADISSSAAIEMTKIAVPAFTNNDTGEYVLTASVDGSGNPTYHWELISRTGSESDQSVRSNN